MPRAKLLNVAMLEEQSLALAPGGPHAGIWLQGCRRRCPGCGARLFHNENRTIKLVPAQDLARWVLNVPGHGVVLTGGEPFLQAPALLEFARKVRGTKFLIAFSGYEHAQLRRDALPGASDLLKLLDLLIDGPYVKRLAIPGPYVGSSNQRLIFLTERFRKHVQATPSPAVHCHVRLTADGMVLTGSQAGSLAPWMARVLSEQKGMAVCQPGGVLGTRRGRVTHVPETR
jgi:anaerobic ribonucleoside-triphosphate reductase activating protein